MEETRQALAVREGLEAARGYAGVELAVVDAAIRALALSLGIRLAMNSSFDT